LTETSVAAAPTKHHLAFAVHFFVSQSPTTGSNCASLPPPLEMNLQTSRSAAAAAAAFGLVMMTTLTALVCATPACRRCKLIKRRVCDAAVDQQMTIGATYHFPLYIIPFIESYRQHLPD